MNALLNVAAWTLLAAIVALAVTVFIRDGGVREIIALSREADDEV